jgi:hypothetical protein
MNRRRIRSLVSCIICSLPLTTVAQQRQLPAIERERFVDGQFNVVSKTEAIPTNVKQAFSKISRQPSFAMANPGQRFQATDVVLDRTLPFRRLVFAGVLDDRWFVHYEKGGYAHGYYVVAFKVDPDGDAHFVWGCSGVEGAKTLEQLRRIAAACQLSKAESYW